MLTFRVQKEFETEIPPQIFGGNICHPVSAGWQFNCKVYYRYSATLVLYSKIARIQTNPFKMKCINSDWCQRVGHLPTTAVICKPLPVCVRVVAGSLSQNSLDTDCLPWGSWCSSLEDVAHLTSGQPVGYLILKICLLWQRDRKVFTEVWYKGKISNTVKSYLYILNSLPSLVLLLYF